MFDRSYWKLLSLLIVLCLPIAGPGATPSPVRAERQVPAAPQAPSAINFTQIAAGLNHTCLLTVSGGVKCWGVNTSGQLGDGTITQRNAPVDVSGLTSGVAAIVAGGYHTCALTMNGGIKCWGLAIQGQIGDGGSVLTNRLTPVDVSGLTSGVTAIAAGGGHTCAVVNGGAKCWGQGGTSGDGTNAQHNAPVDVSGLTSGVTAIAAGGGHTCARTLGGGVKCWGSNSSGQLGDGTTTGGLTPVDVSGLASGVSGIATGAMHTCALTTGGMKCWGSNYTGQVGDGTTTDRHTPMDVTGLTSGVTAIAAGVGAHTCAIIAGGVARCWGSNGSGQVGDGTVSTNKLTPVDVSGLTSGVTAITTGGAHTCALAASGRAKCWGGNGYGELGTGADESSQLIPGDVNGLTSNAQRIVAGQLHTCALTTGGGVKCWGENGDGGMGDGTNTDRVSPTDVSGLTSGVTAIAASRHTCAVTSSGGVKCWGYNFYKQVGDGTTISRSTPTDVTSLTSGVTAVATGSGHTCALTTGSGVKCWGLGSDGQLGDGTTTYTSATPTDVISLTSGVAAIEAGGNHTCALTTGGGVKCWGNNYAGQLGDGTTTSRSAPVDVSGLTSDVTAIAVGSTHTCALMTIGGMKCWGSNSFGQLGDGTTTDRYTPTDVSGLTSGVTAITTGDSHTCAVTPGGAAKCWGGNTSGQLGDGTTTQRNTPIDVNGLASGVTSVEAGGSHTCALTASGGARCWGHNLSGQVGNGGAQFIAYPVNVAIAIPPSLTRNYPNGQPGSFFTITAEGFPENSAATVSINGVVLTTTLPITSTGGFVALFNTTGLSAGYYRLTVSVNPSATTNFTLDQSAPLRLPEGSGTTFVLDGLGLTPLKLVFLPTIIR
ncbi:MAG: RCC1 repeat-containing protein [Chloroflexi bacterium]|nr:RCC1 repeat-containing protein [Chloroflexota bacterium]